MGVVPTVRNDSRGGMGKGVCKGGVVEKGRRSWHRYGSEDESRDTKGAAEKEGTVASLLGEGKKGAW